MRHSNSLYYYTRTRRDFPSSPVAKTYAHCRRRRVWSLTAELDLCMPCRGLKKVENWATVNYIQPLEGGFATNSYKRRTRISLLHMTSSSVLLPNPVWQVARDLHQFEKGRWEGINTALASEKAPGKHTAFRSCVPYFCSPSMTT